MGPPPSERRCDLYSIQLFADQQVAVIGRIKGTGSDLLHRRFLWLAAALP